MKALEIDPSSIVWRPDRQAVLPLHDQIVRWVRNMVQAGIWPLGARLPSQRDLARVFGVNRSTVVTALATLQDHGILASRGTGGTFIASDSWSVLLATRTGWHRRGLGTHAREGRELTRAIQRVRRDPATLHLGSSSIDPALYPVDEVQEGIAVTGTSLELFSHSDAQGYYPLREALAIHLAGRGLPATPENILITQGTRQSLRLVRDGLLEHTATVVYGSPTTPGVLEPFSVASMRMRAVTEDGEGIVPEALDQTLDKISSIQTMLIAMPSVNSPGGWQAGPGRREALLSVIDRHRLPVFEEGSLDELTFGEPATPLAAEDSSQRILYAGSTIHTIAPSLNTGWVMGPLPVIERLATTREWDEPSPVHPSQLLLENLLSQGIYRAHLESLSKILAIRAALAQEAVQEMLGDLAFWREPKGGLSLWVEFGRELPLDSLFIEALDHGVLLNESDIFEGRRKEGLRLSFGALSPEDFREALSRVAPIIRRIAA